MRVAVVGAGLTGLVSAYVLAKAGVEVVVYEKEDYLGGRAKTVTFHGLHFDLPILLFNPVTCPNTMELFESLGIEMEESDMSFSVSLEDGQGCEWGTRNGLSTLFAQKTNVINPYFWQMFREIVKFKQDVISYLEVLETNAETDRNETLGHFISSRGYSELFQKAYIVPICCSFWSCSWERVMSFSAFSVLSFCRNHHLLQLFGRPQWLTVKNRSRSYVNKVKEELESRGCQIRTGSEVHSVSTSDEGCTVLCRDGSEDKYNSCIMTVHAPDAVKILGTQATSNEIRVLGAFQYVYSDVYLHRDKNFMPNNTSAWSAWNFLGSNNNKTCFTYWMNVLQNIEENSPYFVTLNPSHTPDDTLLKWTTGVPVPSVSAMKASQELDCIQGMRGIWFCGAYQGYGFHEDGLKAGIVAANSMLGKRCKVLSNSKQMSPSWMETGARLFITRFLTHYISTGSVILQEDGGSTYSFVGSRKECNLKAVLKIHSPQFYWKVATQADLGIADAYVNGDFCFVDEDEGLVKFILILIANRDLDSSVTKSNKKRRWWSPMLFTATISYATSFFKHVARQNTLTQARRNVSYHYDLSNEFFALFLDETMTYSSGIFKGKSEDLKDAQIRKISSLIDMARIEKKHQVLEIGCGWGSLAIEVVKRTGCKYTGITLSEEQLKYAEMKVKQAGLQENIKFLLCDYRQLPDTNKYDRIISCEMIEHIGHEYVEEFFGCCESLLAEDGLLVLQFTSIPDQLYDEFRLSPGFVKEYIFPGGNLPSLSRITSAMAASSKLCVEHVENIGIHFYQTLRYWRKNFSENQSKILSLGFNDKFMRTWEYYFDYCAAGFKSRTLGNYQIVFSRPGNTAAFSDPYKGFQSAY